MKSKHFVIIENVFVILDVVYCSSAIPKYFLILIEIFPYSNWNIFLSQNWNIFLFLLLKRCYFFVKFRFSEKVTKIWKNLSLGLTLMKREKSWRIFFSNFLASSQYPNTVKIEKEFQENWCSKCIKMGIFNLLDFVFN